MGELSPAVGWRQPVSDEEVADLTDAHGGHPVVGWWDQIRPHSLGWVTARSTGDLLVGFVNVAWDGGDHAFLLDTKTRSSHQRRGIGTKLVERAVQEARKAGCEWLHVDFRAELEPFYLRACGFVPTAAGLIHLHRSGPRSASSTDTEPSAAGRIGCGDASEHRERSSDARGRVIAVVVDDQFSGQ